MRQKVRHFFNAPKNESNMGYVREPSQLKSKAAITKHCPS